MFLFSCLGPHLIFGVLGVSTCSPRPLYMLGLPDLHRHPALRRPPAAFGSRSCWSEGVAVVGAPGGDIISVPLPPGGRSSSRHVRARVSSSRRPVHLVPTTGRCASVILAGSVTRGARLPRTPLVLALGPLWASARHARRSCSSRAQTMRSFAEPRDNLPSRAAAGVGDVVGLLSTADAPGGGGTEVATPAPPRRPGRQRDPCGSLSRGPTGPPRQRGQTALDRVARTRPRPSMTLLSRYRRSPPSWPASNAARGLPRPPFTRRRAASLSSEWIIARFARRISLPSRLADAARRAGRSRRGTGRRDRGAGGIALRTSRRRRGARVIVAPMAIRCRHALAPRRLILGIYIIANGRCRRAGTAVDPSRRMIVDTKRGAELSGTVPVKPGRLQHHSAGARGPMKSLVRGVCVDLAQSPPPWPPMATRTRASR